MREERDFEDAVDLCEIAGMWAMAAVALAAGDRGLAAKYIDNAHVKIHEIADRITGEMHGGN